MFTLNKFLTLDDKSRLRYLWRWLKEAELQLVSGTWPEELMQQLEILHPFVSGSGDPVWSGLLAMPRQPGMVSIQDLGRKINRQHHEIAALIGQEAAEWDLREGLWAPAPSESPSLASEGKKRRVYLDDIRSPFNVGSLFRTAEVFGFDELILSPRCPALDHPRLLRSAMGCTQRIRHQRREFLEYVTEADAQSWSGGVFALELGGRILGEFTFPDSGLVVLGSEELGVNPDILAWCDSHAGRVSIPVCGQKASLNVAVSFGILAHAWAVS